MPLVDGRGSVSREVDANCDTFELDTDEDTEDVPSPLLLAGTCRSHVEPPGVGPAELVVGCIGLSIDLRELIFLSALDVEDELGPTDVGGPAAFDPDAVVSVVSPRNLMDCCDNRDRVQIRTYRTNPRC